MQESNLTIYNMQIMMQNQDVKIDKIYYMLNNLVHPLNKTSLEL